MENASDCGATFMVGALLVATAVPVAIGSVVRFAPAPYETVLPLAMLWLPKALGTAVVRFTFTAAVKGIPRTVAANEIEPGLPEENVTGTASNCTMSGGFPTVRFKFWLL
jgi:hypothetical protein